MIPGRPMLNKVVVAVAAVVALSATTGACAERCPPFAIGADPWPKPGETRRNTGTSYCHAFTLSRAFVAAPGGFVEDEILAARDIAWLSPKPSKPERNYFFIGRSGGYLYGYHVDRSNGPVGPDIRAWLLRADEAGSGSDILFPPLSKKNDESRSINCHGEQRFCTLSFTSRMAPLAHGASFVVRFDKHHRDGNLCVFVPVRRWDVPARITVKADGTSIIDSAVANAYAGLSLVSEKEIPTARPAYYCLGDRSPAMLAAFRSATELEFEVTRDAFDRESEGDRLKLPTAGLPTALELSRYLFETGIANGAKRTALLKAQADALLDKAPQ